MCPGFEGFLYTIQVLDTRGKQDLVLHKKKQLTHETIGNSGKACFIRGQAWEGKVLTLGLSGKECLQSIHFLYL